MPRKQPAASAPAAAPAAGTGKKRQRVNRTEFKYAVWVGNGRSPKFFAKTKDEVHELIKGVKPSQRDNVTIGELKQAVAKTTLEF